MEIANYESQFDILVKNFKRWAEKNYPDITEENDNGEWVFCDEFDEMIGFSLKILENIEAEDATPQLIDNLLFCIARDNDCLILINNLENYPQWFSVLCKASFKTNYINAKWQFAEYLGKYNGDDNLQECIFEFLEIDDEYTQRMALSTLVSLYPNKVEEYVEKHWDKSKEFGKNLEGYHKMMILDVLNRIKSSNLKRYLLLAQQSEHKYLKEFADKILNEMYNNLK